MELYSLTKIRSRRKKRLGQGHGSGRGKTAGRGTRGQKARNKIPIDFEGGALPLIKRLPLMRGKGKNKALRKKQIIVNLKALNFLKKDSIVDLKTLIKNRLVGEKEAKMYGVKILGDGEILIPLTIRLPISKRGAKKIEKIGGKIENV